MKLNTSPTPWTGIVQDWDKIPLVTYQFIFEQAKDRYDEVLSESRSITEKSIGLTKLTIATMGAFVGFKFFNQPNTDALAAVIVLYILDLTCLVILMFPKGIVFRGSRPQDLFLSYLESPEYEEEDKKLIVYYHELLRYQQRMDIMRTKNRNRNMWYVAALILTLLCTVVTVAVLVSALANWHSS